MDQTALAAGIALCGAILLLILGTQILNWYWPVVLFVATLAVGAWRIRRMAPSSYVLAQKIDHRIGSYDALSTAFYFSNENDGRSSELIELHKSKADRIALETDVTHA